MLKQQSGIAVRIEYEPDPNVFVRTGAGEEIVCPSCAEKYPKGSAPAPFTTHCWACGNTVEFSEIIATPYPGTSPGMPYFCGECEREIRNKADLALRILKA
jgi:hypothetical protein